jgi:CubicO group peptidase (beta-lactamase class C family)
MGTTTGQRSGDGAAQGTVGTPSEIGGVGTAAVERFLRSLEQEGIGPHGMVLLRNGQEVAKASWAPYDPGAPHLMFSVSKSFTSTAVGLAVGEGRLALDEEVLDVLPTYASRLARDNVRGMQVRHLLSMSTGHDTDTMALMRALPEDDWVRIFVEAPVLYRPGTHWLYNSGASFVLSAMVQARTGRTVVDYLRPRLFEPLGFEDVQWTANPRGLSLGGSGLRVRVAELARFGQLYLQDGVWEGRRLLPEGWVAQATAHHAVNGDPTTLDDWQQGYGYQFWRCRNGAYRADGAFGQFCIVHPAKQLVLALTSGSERNKRVMELFWEHLFPGASDLDGPAPSFAGAPLQHLGSLPVPDAADVTADDITWLEGRELELPPNLLRLRSFALRFSTGACVFIGTDEDGARHEVRCGRGEWVPGRTSLWECEEPAVPVELTARAGMDRDGAFVMAWQYSETPFRRTLRVQRGAGGTVVDFDLDLPFWAEHKISARLAPGA